MNLIDTNIAIRLLVNDDKKLSEKAMRLLQQSPPHSLELTMAVFLEIAFVLTSVYEISKSELIRNLALLISLDSISCNQVLMRSTLIAYEENAISIFDAYLLARVRLGKNDQIITFDKRLDKLSKKTID